MVQGVQERVNFLLTLLDFAVELISEPLQFFLLLRRLNNIVGLGVFAGRLNFATTRLVFLHEAFVFDAQIFDLVLALLQFDLDRVTFFLGRLDFRVENVHVHLDFLFAFLFRHLQLVLLILERVNLISLCDHLLTQLLNFKFHDVVLHQSLFFALYHSFEVSASHFILKFQLTDDIRKDFLLIFDLLNDLVDVATFVFELLVGVGQLTQLLLVLLQLVVQLPNLLLQLLLFLLGHLTLQLVNPPLHLLDLELLRVKQLLLSLLLDFQLCDVRLQVSGGGQSSRNVANEVGLFRTQFKQRLRLFEKQVLLLADLLLHFSHHVLRLLKFALSHLVARLEAILSSLLLGQALFGGLIFLFGSFEPLHFFFEDFVDIRHIGSLVCQFGGEGTKLVCQDCNLTLACLRLFLCVLQLVAELNQLPLLVLNL